MNTEKHYLTQDKHDALKRELEQLRSEGRREIAENLEYAKQLGDLSENAEYHQAREQQAILEEKIARLDALLKSAVIVNGHESTDVVGVGSKVEIRKEGKKESDHYAIVGTEEADMAEKKLSITSPLGAAMKGKKKGESFSVKTPAGMAKYTLVKVS